MEYCCRNFSFLFSLHFSSTLRYVFVFCSMHAAKTFRLQRGRPTLIEGVYNNSHFVHAVTSHVGNIVQIQTQSGALFEGVFRTFSPHFEIAMELVHRVTDVGNGQDEQSFNASNFFDVLIFKAHDVVYMKGMFCLFVSLSPHHWKLMIHSIFIIILFDCALPSAPIAKDVDLEYATKDTFQTDTAISRCNGSSFEEKELEPWSFDGPTGVQNGELECSLDLDDNANGWDAMEMFNKNESKYGVQSTFDHSLTGYTVQIQKKDTKEFR